MNRKSVIATTALLGALFAGGCARAQEADFPALPAVPAGANSVDPLAEIKSELRAGHYDSETSPTQQLYLLAAMAQDKEMSGMLKKAGANIDAPDAEGRFTALNMMAMNDSVPGLAFLLKEGANPNGHAPTAAGPVLYESIALSSDEVIKTLLENGADPNLPEAAYGATPLIAAVMDRQATHTLMLLDAGADPNKGDKHGVTPLHMSVNLGEEKIARILLDHKADPNQRSQAGTTPLDVARNRKFPNIEKLLRERGAK